ncbi:MAG TPA: MtnX-like HAD-IB family phosphatase [Pirellulaceae bacterium]|nr:MtnX-like HAD-IB family phosphatase [Pirellulaceae bacterium]
MTSHAFGVLVSDFDGTITKRDFYDLVVNNLLPADTTDYWSEYRAGRMTHFEALRGYFAVIQADEPTVLRLVDKMEVDPQLASAVAKLRANGWEVVIASAGCSWYIQRLLAEAGVNIEVHANPGRFVSGRGLLMEMPGPGPFFSATHGIDKAAVVRHYQTLGKKVAFAGDGFPDIQAANLVPPDLRYARGDLARVLAEAGQPFHAIHVWSDIARELLAGGRSA